MWCLFVLQLSILEGSICLLNWQNLVKYQVINHKLDIIQIHGKFCQKTTHCHAGKIKYAGIMLHHTSIKRHTPTLYCLIWNAVPTTHIDRRITNIHIQFFVWMMKNIYRFLHTEQGLYTISEHGFWQILLTFKCRAQNVRTFRSLLQLLRSTRGNFTHLSGVSYWPRGKVILLQWQWHIPSICIYIIIITASNDVRTFTW